MAVLLYMDHHIPRSITLGLRLRGVDVLTAYEDGARELADTDLLTRAGTLGRVLFTFDADFLGEVARRLREGVSFAGVIYAHPQRITIGRCVQDLELLASLATLDDFRNHVVFLPL